MLDQTTLTTLHHLHLSGMAAAWVRQEEEGMEDIPFPDRFALIVEAQRLENRNRRISRLISQASFRFPATIETIEWQGKHGITRTDFLRLAEASFLRKKQNLLLSGPTGVGKTYIAAALGRAVCEQGTAVAYTRLPELLMKLSEAQAENRYRAVMKKTASFPLVILDDWGLRRFTLEETQEVLELFEQRYDRTSTVICSQMPPSGWHELFPDPTLADAILDRVIHNALKYDISGESMRKVLAEREGALRQNGQEDPSVRL
jgi:DNA replication protein DnaC